MNMDKVTVYIDGGAKNNPGPAGIGVVIYKDDQKIDDFSKYIGEATNNQAEYRALIFALKKVKARYGKDKIKDFELEINTDSELVAEQMRGNYKIEDEKIQPLFLEAWNLKMNYGQVVFNLIPREKNQEADHLVKQALSQQKLF